MENLRTIARPYAKAVFEIALKDRAFSDWQEQLSFLSAIVQDNSIRHVVSGVMPKEDVMNSFKEICQDDLNEQAYHLVDLLIQNKRLLALPDISAMFLEMYLAWQEEMDADVISAFTLEQPQVEALKLALERRFSQKVNLNFHLDKELIGGLKIVAKDNVIDGSLRDKLSRMKHTLQS